MVRAFITLTLLACFTAQVSAQDSHPWRAAAEELGLLGVEELNYVKDHDLNSRDWDFRYNINDAPKKFSRISLDTNGYPTNFKMHPLAGSLYYAAARGNGLGWAPSLLYSTGTSLIWEYFGEWREQVSANDVVVTPVGGFLIEEPLHQLGAFFDRGCATLPNMIFGAAVAPVETIHRWVDSRELVRARECDQYGFTTVGSHRLEVRALMGSRLYGGERMTESRIEVGAEIIGVPHYGHMVGEGIEYWTDASVASTRVGLGWVGTQSSDISLESWVMPIGLHAWRSLELQPDTSIGDELLLGLLIGGDVSTHYWGIREYTKDRWFSLTTGVGARYRVLYAGATIELDLQVGAAWTGQDSLALDTYLRSGGSLESLTSVARGERYNYGAGARARPGLRLTTKWLDVGGTFESTRVAGIRALDREQGFRSDVGIGESRMRAEGWIEAGPENWPLRLSVRGAWLRRDSQLGDAHVRIHDERLLLGVGLSF